jgi:hypothetical protein
LHVREVDSFEEGIEVARSAARDRLLLDLDG